MELSELGTDAIPAIAALGTRSLLDPPSQSELERALTATDQPSVLRGDPARGVVATVTDDGQFQDLAETTFVTTYAR